MVSDVLIECTRASDEERVSFGQVVMKLTEAAAKVRPCSVCVGNLCFAISALLAGSSSDVDREEPLHSNTLRML